MQVRNPKYNDQATVDLEIDHPEFGWIPFTASPNDSEELSRTLYSQAIAGDFGAILPYTPPPPYVPTAAVNKGEAERRLVATDWVNQPDVYDPASTPHLTNRDAYLTYRSAIRSIAVSPTGGNIGWPTEPTAVWSV